MYPVFAVLLLALAGCTALVVRRRGAAISEEALGFAVIGAAGLGLLAVAVLVVGRLSAVPGRAEGLALLGLGGFVVYLLAAWVVLRWVAVAPVSRVRRTRPDWGSERRVAAAARPDGADLTHPWCAYPVPTP